MFNQHHKIIISIILKHSKGQAWSVKLGVLNCDTPIFSLLVYEYLDLWGSKTVATALFLASGTYVVKYVKV